MQEAAAFTAEEQKYFDTKGADGPQDDGTPVAPEKVPETQPENNNIGQKADEKATDADDKDNPGKFVRHGAFHEERERRKEFQRLYEQERIANAERNARLEERLSILQRQFEPAQQPQPQDPIQTLQELQQWRQQTETQNQQTVAEQRQYMALKNAVDQHEAEFVKEHADYYEAIDFARQARDKELEIFGFPPNVRQQIIMDDIKAISIGALQQGRSPAQVFYDFAKMRGFTGKQHEVQPSPLDNAAKAMTDAASKLGKIAAGQSAGKSLGAAAGAATGGPLTLEAVANMSNEDFAKISKSEWRKLMGG